MATEASRKFVPGAPPPPPLSKAQKKKRRAAVKKDGESETDTPATSTVVLPDVQAAALTEKAPGEKDVRSGAVAEELVAKSEAPKSEAGDATSTGAGGSKSSPVVELLNKRLRAVGKKITRIHTYSGKPHSELNDDQKKTLATLPSLEAVRKELEETKKAVETLEAEQARDAANARAAVEEAKRQRVAEAVAAAQRAHAERAAQILDFIRFHSLVSNADPSIQALNLVEAELNATYAAVSALLAQDAESKNAVLHGFLHGEGEIEGVSYQRLLEILDAHSQPTLQEEVAAAAEEVVEAVAEAIADAETEDQTTAESNPPAVSGIPNASGGLSFRFMQESEIEGDPVSFENGAEWVEKEDNPQVPVEVSVSVEVREETYVPDQPAANGTTENGADSALNWADDEGELPSIDGLHKTFGTSGSGNPSDANVSAEQQSEAAKDQTPSIGATDTAPPDGNAQAPADDDGFTRPRGGRTREHGGRGRGFRGDRGSFRGDRGGFRGRGGRGSRPYGSDSSNWRSPAEGDQRGRGRGRGRGFDRGRDVASRGGRGGANGE